MIINSISPTKHLFNIYAAIFVRKSIIAVLGIIYLLAIFLFGISLFCSSLYAVFFPMFSISQISFIVSTSLYFSSISINFLSLVHFQILQFSKCYFMIYRSEAVSVHILSLKFPKIVTCFPNPQKNLISCGSSDFFIQFTVKISQP